LRRATFDAVNGITRYLPVALLDRAYGWLCAIPAVRYDEVTVAAIKDFTQVNIQNNCALSSQYSIFVKSELIYTAGGNHYSFHVSS
jgi:hypothetical protein